MREKTGRDTGREHEGKGFMKEARRRVLRLPNTLIVLKEGIM